MVIVSTDRVSQDCVKVTTGAGPSFFLRLSYLTLVSPDSIAEGAEFDIIQEADIIDAGLIYSVERKALSYLERAEQCRAGLLRKLQAKGFEEKYITTALDYLESCSCLSDFRYACAWLNNRKISRYEGRIRLAAELSARGIGRETVSAALDDFFAVNSEQEFCSRALDKCRRIGKREEKIQEYLKRCGFTFSMIKQAMKKT